MQTKEQKQTPKPEIKKIKVYDRWGNARVIEKFRGIQI